jgi:hypothetical protein
VWHDRLVDSVVDVGLAVARVGARRVSRFRARRACSTGTGSSFVP